MLLDRSDPSSESSLRPQKRVFGTARVLCGGRIISPKDGHHSLLLAGVVLFPVIVFLVSVVPSDEIFSYVIVGTLGLLDVVSLLLSTTLDPGVILPQPPDPNRQPQVVQVNGHPVECKICTTCNVLRPPRSSHCSVCDWCVEEYDHHCGVVGSCVARRTFRFFTFFLDLSTALAAYIVVRSIIELTRMNLDALSTTNGGRWKIVATFGCVVYCGIGGLCVFGQASFYTYLGCCNLTQKELHRREPFNPYHRGILTNVWLRFVQPLSDSRLTRIDVAECV